MSLSVKYYDVPGLDTEQIEGAGTGAQPFSQPGCPVKGEESNPYATLENGGWPLDGSRVILSDTPPGYWWSEAVSDSSGELEQPLVLTLSFPEAVTTTGLTFSFWPAAEQWCTRMQVSWYNAGGLLNSVLVYPDQANWTLEKTVEGFDGVRVELFATNVPGQFAKLEWLQLGQVRRFEKDELVSVQLVNEIDPTFCNLSVDTMQVQVRCQSVSRLAPQENQRVVLYRDKTPLATHYITGSSRQDKHLYTLQAQSGIGILEDTFLGGMYQEVPVERLMREILGGWRFELDSCFSETTVTGYLPVCTRREALQQLAIAIGAVISTSGDGEYYVRPLSRSIQGSFSATQIFQGAKVTSRPRYSRVEVAAHSYMPGGEETVLLEEELLEEGEVLLTFDEPYYDYQISGGEIISSGANYIRVEPWAAVTVTAKPYIHNVKLFSRQDPMAVSTERGNVLTVDKATLVHSGNASAVLKRLYDTAQLRQELTQDAVIAQQRAGQQVASISPWDTQIRGYITAMDSNLTEQGQVASLKIMGVEIEEQRSYGYSGEMFAGEKEVLW